MLLLAFAIGVVAGLRTMTAPAAVAWAASNGVLAIDSSPLEFLGWRFTPWLLTLLAAGELVFDKMPATPSRKMLMPFAARMFSGALSGAAIGIAGNAALAGLALGVLGAMAGTLAGAWGRARLAACFGRDLPAALAEDALAIGLAALVVHSL